ncbi:MAG: C25 family cysteine peptidase [Ginsengibacter sp.]
MKKILLLFFVTLSLAAFAQPYNNGWIDYNKTYYKFKVGATGFYRISQTSLNTIGLGITSAEQFQLWRNGQQVMIYTSSATGPLGTSGYIEFWGMMNDGTKDTKLYRNPDYQLSDHWSLETDTAAYFLTVNPASANLRYTNAANNIAGNVLAAEPYFMNTSGVYYKNMINSGYAIPVGGLYVYSSSYDIGEGYSSNDIYPGGDLSAQIDNLNLYAAGPEASFKIGLSGNAPNSRNIRVKLFNTVIIDQSMSYFAYLKKQVNNIPLSNFTNPDFLQVHVQNASAVPTDRMVVSFIEIKYPSKFNFNNKTNFYFELPASVSGNYLVIDNFNYGTTAPVLLDLNSGNRFTADISTPGKVKVVLPPSSDALRKFVLVNEEISTIKPVNNFAQINFVNYGTTANQANYMIISNAALFNNGAGINYVDQYRAYRASATGGSFNAKVFDIDQLTDQFAFGIKNHPFAVKDFVQYAKNNFTDPPRFLFLIGKGVCYNQFAPNESNVLSGKINLVPTYGYPASDVLLASNYGSIVPDIPVGRLSVVNGNEVGNYLKKMDQYEGAQASSSQTVADKGWMKNVINVIGGKDSSENYLFNFYMDGYKNILQDTFFGAKVETFSKSSAAAVQLIASKRIEDLFSEGMSILGYFGHSSANTLEFNLNSPETYQNQGKYPFFNVSGCTAGDNYIYDATRLTGNVSLSEKYILADQRGSIGFLASSHLGIPPILDNYNKELYNNISNTNYGKPIGIDIMNTIKNSGGALPGLDYFTRANLEEINLHGDPALKINAHEKPDYVIEDPMVKINPAFISVSEDKFTLDVKMLNIGKAIKDSIVLEIKRTYPNGASEIIYRNKIKAIYYGDSLRVDVPIIATRDKGINKITVTIDADNDVSEISETNNSITKEFFIYEDEVNPTYPYNYAIIKINNQKLFASTANPFSASKQYVMELDTTELFNSSQKITKTIISAGGVIEYDPGITYTDSTVYYWRVASVPAAGTEYHWNSFSFIYLSKSTPGANQSHYFQHLKSDTLDISLQADRKWRYSSVLNNIHVKNGVFPTAASLAPDFLITINGSDLAKSVCGISNIIINVFDPISLMPWKNVLGPAGLYGSDQICGNDRINNFQYNILDRNKRKKAMDFLDMIPDNAVVVVRNTSGTDPLSNTYAADWQADTAFFGVNNTLYHRFISQGFALIDSFYKPRSFIFLYQKNHPDFGPQFTFSEGIFDKIELNKNYATPDTIGYITSPRFGPAKSWKEMHWRGTSEEANSTDNPAVDIIGITNGGTATKLFTVNKNMQDFDISSISATRYPFVQLKMRNIDSVTLTPYQLGYWRVNYDPAPEGALTPNIFFTKKDTLDAGEKLSFGIAFKNISPFPFDSIRIKAIIIDKNNVSHSILLPKQKPLITGDTILFKYDIDTKNYVGLNTLNVDFNPDNDQPEQSHFNNFLFLNFFVKPDNFNPLLDVTFDGVHILNRDIVSARPHIVVKLKDESKFLALSDTSLIKVQIRYPDNSLHDYKFDNDTLRFTPANLASGENTATIDFSPLLPGDDEEYELIVSGKDVSGNTAGHLEYRVTFTIISKPMISNLLNYPNPFTTSTAFVFTVTGTQPPQNIRIQILTITGKIVREITKDELGSLHVGRNITEFKWDGTDMYGQKLANGVYLYRVLTNLNGRSLDRYKAENDHTDKYFTKGYGKMYLMR